MAAARYREEVLLGTGGMAEVWLAQGPEGMVALKRLLPHAARDPDLAAAFEREGKLLSRIRHPNVVGIHDVMRDERGTCLVLEYVEGADLGALSTNAIPDRVALRIARDVLRALEAVHDVRDERGQALGIIHRDLKPANVLIGIDGRVKLTDFGIARALAATKATTGNNVKGTLAYLSPEQAMLAPLDARTDLFSVGALLYEMLAGEPIYNDEDPRLVLARARAGDVGSLGLLRPDLPQPIIELVDRALASTPAGRFPSAALMLSDLERAAEQSFGLASEEEVARWSLAWVQSLPQRPIAAPPAAHPSVSRLGATMGIDSLPVTYKIARRKSRLAVATILGAALALIGVGLALRFARSPGTAPEPLAPSQSAAAAPPAIETRDSVDPIAPMPKRADHDEAVTSRASAGRALRLPAGSGMAAPARTPSTARATAPAARAAQPNPARTAVAQEQLGVLDLGSEPGFAYVTIDGVSAGATPLFGHELTAGLHRVDVSREGLGSKTLTIDVRPGERVSRVVKLP
jgi:serine/threonine-protein kinase